MDEKLTKEENQPSTSSKESLRPSSRHDSYDYIGNEDRATNTESTVTATYSARSRLDMADTLPMIPKPPVAKRKREPKAPVRKKQTRRALGRVDKRRRSVTRRQLKTAPKRKPRAKQERKNRGPSMSSLFTRLSSRSGFRPIGCKHCGHRSCRRR